MYPESFIKHSLTHGKRLEYLLHQVGMDDWRWQEGEDIVIQEYSIDGMRVDILATMNGCSRLVVVEVKSVAHPTAVTQLDEYLKYFQDVQNLPPKVRKSTEKRTEYTISDTLVGLLVASDFIYYSAGSLPFLPKGIKIIKFDLEKTPILETGGGDLALLWHPTVIKRKKSDLTSVDDFIRTVSIDKEMETMVRRVSECFIDPMDSKKKAWLVRNPTKRHMSSYYKGEAVLCLMKPGNKAIVENRKIIAVLMEGNRKPENYGMDNIGELETEISASMDRIDEKQRKWTKNFEWPEDLQ